MRFLALATDYDGTLASQGAVLPSTLESLERLRATGRKTILVTGRELGDLKSVFPRLDLFDRVVAENGALLYRPRTHEEVALAEPASEELVKRLQARKVEPLSIGHSIVATREPHEVEAISAIRELGLELQVIFNKGAVMILPTGVNKQTGLAAALGELGLSARNTVAVGDAENDHAMLSACECGVAVANALESLKDRADLVTRAARGAGVEELIDRLIEDDLRSIVVPRHTTPLGLHSDGTVARMPSQGRRVLVAGPSSSGKTTCATGILERLMDAGYQCCVIDPEGDYEQFEGMLAIGNPERAPTAEEVLEIMQKPDANLVVNLLGIPLHDRPGFFASLLPRLQELRSKTGRPHWIVLDEAHHLLPAAWQPAASTLPRELGGVLLITVHPEHLSPAMLAAVDTAIAVGPDHEKTLAPLVGDKEIPSRPLGPDEILVWTTGRLERLQVLPPKGVHRRHRRKYAAGDVQEKAFVFKGPDGKLSLRAQNLSIFLQMAEGIDEETWLHHLRQRDYSKWFRRDIKDEALAEEAEQIERRDDDPQGSRRRMREAIEKRYTLPE